MSEKERWHEAVDAKSKRVYLYRADSDETKWKAIGDWDVLSDPASGRHYYVHRITKKTQWEMPNADSQAPVAPPPFPIRRPDKLLDDPDWQKTVDRQTGQAYYFNARTGESRIDMPPAVLRVRCDAILNVTFSLAAGRMHTRAPHLTPYVQRSMSIAQPSPAAAAAAPAAAVAADPHVAVSAAAAMKSHASSAPTVLHSGAGQVGPLRLRLPKQLQDNIHQFQLEGYAKDHFRHQRRGLFRRRVPLQEILTYSPDPLAQPLLPMKSSALEKEALGVFAAIQGYMGDRSSKRDACTLAQHIVSVNVNTPELRDETYCQLFKQTTGHPKPDSMLKGWELLLLAALSFPPSKDFESYVWAFLDQAAKQSGKAEVRSLQDAPFVPSLFNVTLEEIMARPCAADTVVGVPRILTVLTDALRKHDALQTEGIFRIPGDADDVLALRDRFEKDDYRVDSYDVHAMAGLLKLWLRELAEPLFPIDI